MAHNRHVTSTKYPYLSIKIGLRRVAYEVSALLDTGFSGDLAIPTSFLDELLDFPDAAVDWQLADGSAISAPVYFGTVQIIGPEAIPATITALGNEYILGRGIIDHFRVILDHGRQLTVEP